MNVEPGEKFWFGLVFYVLSADIVLWRRREKTMSGVFGNWCERPQGKAACVVTAGAVASHLFFGTPMLPGIKRMRRFVQNV